MDITSSLGEEIITRALKYEKRQAMVCSVTGRIYTYDELANNSVHLGKQLSKLGLNKGDVLTLMCHNCPEFTVVCLAALLNGAIVSTANPSITVDELRRQLTDNDSKFIFSGCASINKVRFAQKSCPNLKCIIIKDAVQLQFDCLSYDSLMAGRSSTHRDTSVINAGINIKSVALLPYSSGTTGLPKGVMLTHYNVMANLIQFSHPSVQTEDPSVDQEVYISAVPMFHVFGLVLVQLYGLFMGHKIVYMPRFSLKEYLLHIQNYKVTILHLVPPIIIMMLNQARIVQMHDLSSVHLVHCGAASLGKDSEEAFLHLTGIPAINQGYGMTEASPVLTAAPHVGWKSGSVGIPLFSTEAKVVDIESGKSLLANQPGELWFRGPQVMKGYWKRPDATRETIDADGWLHTGDIGHFDEDGHFYVTDRLKELIKYKGHQVAPAELESILLTHPDVEDAAVIGQPDHMAGEMPMAFIVRKPNSTVASDNIQDFVKENVAPHKWLRGGVVFIPEIPKSPSGKILRRMLKARITKSKL